MSLHDQWAARFEAEGASAYRRSTGGNPYNAGTMAHDRWAKGFMDALTEGTAHPTEGTAS